jgi:hypothetical protein
MWRMILVFLLNRLSAGLASQLRRWAKNEPETCRSMVKWKKQCIVFLLYVRDARSTKHKNNSMVLLRISTVFSGR